MSKEKQHVKIIGTVEILLKDRKGKIIRRIVKKNLVTDVGIQYIVKALANQVTLAAFQYIAIGSGTTAPSGSDTALENELFRKAGTITIETTNISGDTLRVEATFTFDANYSISESGLFNASSGGTMLARQTFSAIDVTPAYELTIVWKIVVSR
ncbi:MAG: hypothetical protein DRP00_02935 [Candidatus Aenigmatarchaeota archaeon]|nr:MAG: hypothetical protein DRP00_02935 [Candidatus Aenigmarchaeota archaeon]